MTRWLAAGCIAMLSACSADVVRTNPYDPDAPVERQLKGKIRGTVSADAAFVLADLSIVIEGNTRGGLTVDDIDVVLEDAPDGATFEAEVPAGRYSVLATLPRFAPATLFGIEVQAGTETDVGVIHLRAGRGTLTGTVLARTPTGEDVAPPVDTRVTLMRLSQPFVASTSEACATPGPEETLVTSVEADGTFSVGNLAAGPYLVAAERGGYVPAVSGASVDVDPGQAAQAPGLVLLRAAQMVRIATASDPDAAPGGLSTRDADVTLNLVIPPLYNAQRISADPTFTDPTLGDVGFSAAQTSVPTTLPPEDGYRELFVQFRAPTCALSPIYAAGVILDTVAPIANAAALASGATCTSSSSVVLSLGGEDPCLTDSCAGLYQMQVALDGSADTEPWIDFNTQQAVDLGADGTKTVAVRVRDRAGNTSEQASSQLVVNSTGPQFQTPALTFNGGASLVRSLVVRLGFNVSAATDVELGNAPGLDGSAWMPLPLSGELDWRLLDGADGPRTVYVRFRDDCGNVTQELTAQTSLDRSALLAATVRLEGRTAHDGTTVSLWRLEESSGSYADTGMATPTGSGGEFVLSGLTPGTYRVDLSHTGFVSRSIADLALVAGQELRLGEFALAIARGTLRGRATLAGETNNEGIRISVGQGIVVYTDQTGSYEMVNVPVDSYDIVAERGAAFTPAATTQSVQVTEGALVDAPDLVLQPVPGSLTGTVRLSGRAVHSGISVVVEGLSVVGGLQTDATTTADDGTFILSNLTAGTYAVRFSAPGFVTREVSGKVVTPTNTTVVEPTALLPAAGSIRGVVELSDRTSHEGVRLSLQQSGSEVAFTYSDTNGNYAFPDVPVGQYTLVTKMTGYARRTVTSVVVEADLETVIDVLSIDPQIGDVWLEDSGGFVLGAATNLTTVYAAGSYPDAATATVCENPAIQPHIGGDPASFVSADCQTVGVSPWSPIAVTFAAGSCPSPLSGTCDGQRTLYVQVQDSFGVDSNWFELPVVLDRLPPTGLIAIEPGASTVVGGVITDQGDSYTRFDQVEVAVTAADDRSGVSVGDAVSGVTEARLYRAVDDTLPLITAMSESLKVLPGVGLLPGDGPKALYLVVVDAAGNLSQTDLTSGAIVCPDPRDTGAPPSDCDRIFLDTTPPPSVAFSIAPLAIDGDYSQGHVYSTTPVVLLGIDSTITTLPEDYAVEAVIANDPGFVTSVIVPLETPRDLVNWALLSGDGTKEVNIRLRDAAGNLSGAFPDTIELDTTPPAAPLIFPLNDYISTARPTLNWGPVSDADHYVLYLSNNVAFVENSGLGQWAQTIDPVSTPSWTPAADLQEEAHYWYVVAVDAAGQRSAASRTDSFVVELTKPAQPVLAAVTTPTTDTTPTLSWTAPAEQLIFRVELDTVASFDSGATIRIDTSAGFVTAPVLSETTWHARVMATDLAGNTSPWSNTISFLVDATAPANPALTGPGDGALLASSSVTVTWNAVGDATAYRVQSSATDTFASYDEQRVVGTEKTLNLGDGTWWVRVGAEDAAGNLSDFGAAETRSVTLDTTPPDVPQPTPVASPTQDATPKFMWSSVSDADVYILTLDGTPLALSVTDYTPPDPLTDASHTWTVAARDAAGNRSADAVSQTFVVDATPPDQPVLTPLAPDPSATDTPTVRWTTVPEATSYIVEWDTVSTFDSVDHGAVSTSSNTYAIGPLDEGAWLWRVIALDAIGNTSIPSATDPFVVDTLAPSAGTLALAGSAEYTASVTPSLGITTGESGLWIELSGDIAEVGTYLVSSAPTTVTLTGGEGANLVIGVLIDAAGNRSSTFSDLIIFDETKPAAGSVVWAGGQTVVNTQTISVSISNTAPDTMRLWEVGAASPCGVPVCTDPSFEPFVPSTSVTLTAGLGDKRMCACFCDLAGNTTCDPLDDGTTGVPGTVITLDNYLARPRPVLDGISPLSHVALRQSTYTLTATGMGIADDTVVEVGDFVLPCEDTAGYAGCEAGNVAGTCATSCEVTLPDAIMRVSGTYLVRLTTPPPIDGGVGTSADSAYFHVVAPRPAITRVMPRGLVQPLDGTGVPAPPGPFRFELRGYDLMDNVQILLEGNFGWLVSFDDDPTCPTCKIIVVDLEPVGVVPADAAYELVVTNPTPGGGEVRTPFGVNPEVHTCPGSGLCSTDLRWTRARLPDQSAVFHTLSLAAPSQPLAWSGGSAARVLDPAGAMLARVRENDRSGLILLPNGASHVQAEEELGRGPAVATRRGAVRGRGAGGVLRTKSFGVTAEPGAVAIYYGAGSSTDPEVAFVDPPADEVVTCTHDHTACTGTTRFAVGSAPADLAVADVNQDGMRDLVVANSGSDDVSILLRISDISFDTATQWAVGSSPVAVVAVDLDGDGSSDLVTANAVSADVSVRLGRSDGTFGLTQSFGAAATPNDLAAGDVDGDGIVDLAVGSAASGSVAVLYGLGDGSFEPPQSVSMGTAPAAMALVDLNVDGLLDVVTVDGTDAQVVSRLNIGDRVFAAAATAATLASPTALVTADLDSDGWVDVAVGHGGSGTVRQLFGRGDGTFGGALDVAMAAYPVGAMAAADLESKGRLSLLATHGPDEYMSWRDSTSLAILHSSTSSFVRVADANRDGHNDVLISDTVLLGSRDGSFADLGVGVGTQGGDADIADVDGDGIVDLIVPAGDRVSVFRGLGDGGFGGAQDLMAGTTSVNHVHAVDFTADGFPDLVVGDGGTGGCSQGAVYTSINNGDGTFQALATFSSYSGGTIASGDFNGDGLFDVIMVHGGYDRYLDDEGYEPVRVDGYSAYLNRGGGVLARVGGSPTNKCRAHDDHRRLAIADVDGDDILDAIFGGPTYRLGLGDGRFGGLRYYGGSAVPSWGSALPTGKVTVTDYDSDGFIDILNDGRVYLGDGAGTFSPGATHETTYGLIAAELDWDGMPNLVEDQSAVAREYSLPETAWWVWELKDMPAMTVALTPGSHAFTVSQGEQAVDRVALSLRMNDPSQSLNALRISLESPRGELLVLDDPSDGGCGTDWSGRSLWNAAYPTTPVCAGVDMADFEGVQPAGDWTLHVDNAGTATVELRDFAVTTHGHRPRRPVLGESPDNPRVLLGSVGKRMLQAHDSTAGLTDEASLSCAATQGDVDGDGWLDAADRFYELVLDYDATVSIYAVADFDAALELRSGACASAGAVIACDDDSLTAGMQNPALSPQSLTAGSYCIVVDGRFDSVGPYAYSGELDLFVQPDRAFGCGDGVPEAPEECDDGNAVNGDGCDVNCTSTGCGNSIVTGIEECDDGPLFNKNVADACRTTCVLPYCGDDIRDSNEGCDPGTETMEASFCSAGCKQFAAYPIIDSFENPVLDSTYWASTTGSAGPTTAYAYAGSYSLMLDGIGAGVTSQAFDTSTCGSLGWWGYIRRGPSAPEGTDYLRLRYHDGGTWQEAWSLAGAADTQFNYYEGYITDPAALYNGLRIQWYNDSNSTADDFYLDNFFLLCLAP